MSRNRELHRQLHSPRARFCPADFHVHSPASADVRVSPRFEQLSLEAQKLLGSIPISIANNPVEYEAEVLGAFPPKAFYSLLVTQRDALLSGAEAEDIDDWGMVAITDHNVCKYACEVASHAWTQLSAYRLIVMPGIELSVTYPVPLGNNLASAHVLCIFRPNTSDSDIRIAISAAADVNWTSGQGLTLQSLPTFVNNIRHHPDYPAICIAAHVGSSKGVHNETGNAILSRLEAAISRVRGELQAGDNADEEALRERLDHLERERDEADEIALDILDLIGRCGFDALQVKGRKDEIHYRLLHRFRAEMGRAVPIVCSDAHRQQDIFTTESGVPHLKLSAFSAKISPEQAFDSVVGALRLGETRFSYVSPESPLYWIGGIEISPDAPKAAEFWPFRAEEDSQSRSFVLPLSRNFNCLIGGRGSGKSAALEALAFLAQGSDFDGFDRRRKEDIEEHYDYYSRAQATLAGCNVKMCWQFVKHEEANDLPKKAVFASRYFALNDRHPAVSYFSADDTELLPQQIPEHSIQYYRLGQIEKQAGPSQLRVLFDRICGKQIQEHGQNISQLVALLQEQRIQMVEISKQIAELTQTGSPLRHYAQCKSLFDAVNTKEIKEAYEEVDHAAAAESRAKLATEEWATIRDDIALDDFAEQVKEFFDQLNAASTDNQHQPKPYQEKLAELSSSQPLATEEIQTPHKRVADAIQSLDTELDTVAETLAAAEKNIATRAKTARDALEEKGLPTGSKDREAKKTAFEEAESALGTYRELVAEWDLLNDARKELVKQLQDECQKRTKLRQDTATRITDQLRRDLDPSVLVIEADAQAQTDKSAFITWLDTHFSFQEFKHRKVRIAGLIYGGLTPSRLRNLLLDEGDEDETLLQVDAEAAEFGAISSTVAQGLLHRCIGRCRLECEVEECNVEANFWKTLPQEIRDGLFTFPALDKNQDVLRIDDILQLDEITFDDEPVIRLNDRPEDERSKPRRVEALSPGQRCSAILPILLLTGTSPLLIDQPEDNMDNRLIRQVIINILSSIKLRRQVIFATHNPNLPVLGDVEEAIVLQGVGERECEVGAIGDLDSSDVVHHLTEVMEGGREAFQYRQTIYQIHWPGPVSTVGIKI